MHSKRHRFFSLDINNQSEHRELYQSCELNENALLHALIAFHLEGKDTLHMKALTPQPQLGVLPR